MDGKAAYDGLVTKYNDAMKVAAKDPMAAMLAPADKKPPVRPDQQK